MVNIDVDKSVAVAWRAFEHRLAADLVELASGHALRVEVPTGRGGRSPVALTLRRRPRTILVSAAGSPPLRGAGSRPRRRPPDGVPQTKQFRVGTESQIASWTVDVLRNAYGVLHPAFLSHTRRDPDDEPVRSGAVSGRTSGSGGFGRPIGLEVPTSPEQLDDLVERALSAVAPLPLVRDHDGDIPLVSDHGVVFVRVLRDQPMVEVFALIERIDDGEDPARAVSIANSRNTRSTLATFVVMHGCLISRVAIWCHPFVPVTLLHAVEHVTSVLAESAERAAHHIGIPDMPDGYEIDELPAGVTASNELDPELLTIIQLDAADPGSVSAELAARIYDYDRDRLLAGIRTSEEQMLEWRSSIEAARERDEEEAVVCAGESASWQATADLLRAALRVAVER